MSPLAATPTLHWMTRGIRALCGAGATGEESVTLTNDYDAVDCVACLSIRRKTAGMTREVGT